MKVVRVISSWVLLSSITHAGPVGFASIDDGTTGGEGKAVTVTTEIGLKGAENVIIRNIRFRDLWEYDSSGEYDSLGWDYVRITSTGKKPTRNVWVDQCDFGRVYDGQLDVVHGLDLRMKPDPETSFHDSPGEFRFNQPAGFEWPDLTRPPYAYQVSPTAEVETRVQLNAGPR